MSYLLNGHACDKNAGDNVSGWMKLTESELRSDLKFSSGGPSYIGGDGPKAKCRNIQKIKIGIRKKMNKKKKKGGKI